MTNETTPRLLYGISRTAEMLDSGRTAVYGLINRGELTMVKVGRRSMITAESLGDYVQRLTSAAGQAEPHDDDCDDATASVRR